MQSFKNLIDRLSLGGAYLSSLLIMVLVVLIMTEIIGRSFFDTSTMLADEYSGYLYLALVFFGLAYTLKEEGHIRISILSSRLKSTPKRYLDLSVGVITFLTMCYVIYYSLLVLLDVKQMEMVSENVSETPIWLTQIPIPIGIALFMLAIIGFMIKRRDDDI